MWSVFRKSNPRKNVRQKRLGRFERLESRWCLAAPTITSFSVAVGPGRSVTLTGQVSDENPSMVMVQFTGAVSATVFTNGQGQFSYSTQNCQLGTVTARARDMEMLWSQPVNRDISSVSPIIAELHVVESGPNRQVTISGSVYDEDKAGLPISITGKVTATGYTDACGDFSITATATGLGEVIVTVVDPWGLQDAVNDFITSAAPAILDLSVTDEGYNFWTIRGRVSDEFAPGLTVRFGGVLQGQSATVQSNNYFEITVQVSEAGEACAWVYDWWGIQSELEFFEIG